LNQFILGVIIFGSVWFLSKKVTKPNFFLNKPKPGQTDRFRFGSGFLGKNRFKPVWLGFLGFGSVFSGFGSVFPVWLGFFSSFFRFRFSSVFSYKTKTEPAGFFKILIGSVFSVIFFRFSRFYQSFDFFLTPALCALSKEEEEDAKMNAMMRRNSQYNHQSQLHATLEVGGVGDALVSALNVPTTFLFFLIAQN